MGNLQKAIKLEKKGKYKSALKYYQNIDRKNITYKDYLYARRSIAACLYYLKEYDKALHEFETILENISLDAEMKNQIEENMHLCFLYGTSTQKAIDFYQDRIMKDKKKSENNCWWFWYQGQGYQKLKKYEEAEKSYENAYNMSNELKYSKAGFFLLYMAAINIFQKRIKEADKILFKYNNIYNQNEDNGLYDILKGLVIMREDSGKGKKLYKKGLRKAKKENWTENIELAQELINNLQKN